MTALLAGVKVLSLTHYLQGPSCVQFLADLGADVIKVERIGGAYERYWSGANTYVEDESVFFMLAGRNQRSIELDFRTFEGSKVLWSLIDESDVLVENFRPGVLTKYGFSYEEVSRRNPGIIFCSLTGYGSTGPAATNAGQDLLVQSLSGLISLSGSSGTPPTPVGTAVVDQHAATIGALGILAALVGRSRTGKGVKVDSNLLSAALDLQIEPLTYYLNGAKLWERSESGISSRFHDAPYGVFKTADGWLTLSMSRGELLADAFEDRRFVEFSKSDQFTRREELNSLIAEKMATRSMSEWEKTFSKAGVWHAPVRDYDDVESDPQIAHNNSFVEFDLPRAGRVRLVNHPVRYDGVAPEMRLPPPKTGEHTTEVLTDLGYNKDAIASLRSAGAAGPDRASTPVNRGPSAPRRRQPKSVDA